MTDDALIEELRARLRDAPRRAAMWDGDTREAYPPATPAQIAQAEAQLGFPVPSFLRRVFCEVANGGFGPGYGVFPVSAGLSVPHQAETIVMAHVKLAQDPAWPARLLPICDWGCANWSCLDCRTDNGAVVTLAEEQGFFDTGHDLRSWLNAWLAGTDLWSEMFEPGPVKMGMNPFTRRPMKLQGRGNPRGRPWLRPA